MCLQGKKILVGVSGGIAAYKTLLLIRLLRKEGAEVRCVCTPASLQFVTPLSLSSLSGNPIYSDMFSPRNENATAHITYADWADLLVVAPATANTMAKFANGIADNALTTLYTAFAKPVLLAPAMNTNMYAHPAVQANMEKLRERGVDFVEAGCGALACGSEGKGRMAEPETIFSRICSMMKTASSAATFFQGKKVLITAGPTVEAIDPVRYISNHSTGLMGVCLADELTRRGAQVFLVCGPLKARPRHTPFRTIPVVSAADMYRESLALWPEMDMGILSAAVADYRPKVACGQKIKKSEAEMTLELIKTDDILATLGKSKRANQFLAGFALETENETANAVEKLHKKNADLIVLNSMRDAGAGFGTVTNKVSFLDRTGRSTSMELKRKEAVAADILDYIESLSLQF